ncbi:hypothetical protein CRH09_31090 [Nocardia terpenica]|uniref:Uncharacterized protein n=2 Tax=Nocardia terpenica TaxID=455432 RepID=A0A291RRU2_9NOCA|nr:hypothetical protein CRH09_31090 [Nocardia terpenica]
MILMAQVQRYPVPSVHEQQIAMSALAHTARRDIDFVITLINMIQDPDEGVRPAYVIFALLAEFEKGMDVANAEELAQWFSGEAQALATRADLS